MSYKERKRFEEWYDIHYPHDGLKSWNETSGRYVNFDVSRAWNAWQEANKQYEQQLKQCRDDLFNLRMDNARLELDALRWSVFDCPVNRDIADKLLNKLADEAVETR